MKGVSCMLLAVSLHAAVVTRPVANMYSKPTDDSEVVSQAIYGSPVSVIEKQAGFSKIRTADDYSGWISNSDLREGAYADTGKRVQVQSLFAHIYREPDLTKHRPLITVPFEARLETVAPVTAGERWLKVRLVDDREGYVQSGDVSEKPETMSIPEMLAFAKRFLGLPYTWGGTSSYGYDCSGFTQMLCRRRGVMLPRDAGPQARWSGVVPVKPDELQPGDLLYFGKSAERITHTGTYLGDGRFIHATAHEHPVIQISELNDPHWTQLLVACRRVK